MIRISTILLLYLLVGSTAMFAQQKQEKLFTLMDAKQTGLSYLNTIEENEKLHVMNYEYLYNGAGVGVADFNNDGLIDVFFSGNTGANKLFLNKGNFQFTDITNTAKVGGNGTWSTGVSIADVNGDGLIGYICMSFRKIRRPEKVKQ